MLYCRRGLFINGDLGRSGTPDISCSPIVADSSQHQHHHVNHSDQVALIEA